MAMIIKWNQDNLRASCPPEAQGNNAPAITQPEQKTRTPHGKRKLEKAILDSYQVVERYNTILEGHFIDLTTTKSEIEEGPQQYLNYLRGSLADDGLLSDSEMDGLVNRQYPDKLLIALQDGAFSPGEKEDLTQFGFSQILINILGDAKISESEMPVLVEEIQLEKRAKLAQIEAAIKATEEVRKPLADKLMEMVMQHPDVQDGKMPADHLPDALKAAFIQQIKLDEFPIIS